MSTQALRATAALSGIELTGGAVVVFILGGGHLATESRPLLWIALALSGCTGLLVRRAGGSALLAGAFITALGLAALALVGWATAQPPLPGGGFAPEILAAMMVLVGGAAVGWAGGVVWAARQQPHLWT